MSNKQNDIIIDNLIDRMENLGIFDLLVGNDKGFLLKDLKEIEKYCNFFEKLDNNDYFWKLGVLKAKIKGDQWGEQMRKAHPDFCNALQHAYFIAGLTPTDGKIETNTEYGEIKDEPISNKSTIL